jgi:hypothetical protein
MATGIVSLASHLRGVPQLAWGLLGLNVIAYAILMALLLVRVLRFGERVSTTCVITGADRASSRSSRAPACSAVSPS